jgi:hypothetical protein
MIEPNVVLPPTPPAEPAPPAAPAAPITTAYVVPRTIGKALRWKNSPAPPPPAPLGFVPPPPPPPPIARISTVFVVEADATKLPVSLNVKIVLEPLVVFVFVAPVKVEEAEIPEVPSVGIEITTIPRKPEPPAVAPEPPPPEPGVVADVPGKYEPEKYPPLPAPVPPIPPV